MASRTSTIRWPSPGCSPKTAASTDAEVLAAALLHDTVEDTQTSVEKLAQHVGPRIAGIATAVTDDMSLPKAERKRLQIEHAPYLSMPAKLVKLSDKICNIQDVIDRPPDWSLTRWRECLVWAMGRGRRMP